MSMADAEFIVVCVDNSTQMHHSSNYDTQLDAIKRYCKTKLDANPETEVVLFTMGAGRFGYKTFPTSDYQIILDSLRYIGVNAGRLCFRPAICYAQIPFSRCPPNKHKRMLFFARGYVILCLSVCVHALINYVRFFAASLVDLDELKAQKYGTKLKEFGIAVDVVNFYLGERPKHTAIENQYGMAELGAFVYAANDKHNSHIGHVKPGSSIRQVLSKYILRHTLRLSRKNHKKATGKNEAAGDNKHVRSEASSPENEGAKLGKRKWVCMSAA